MLGQIGTTIALGLLFDTLIVRSFMTPSIAALLGRWFWWPLNIRPAPPAQRVTRRGVGDAAEPWSLHRPPQRPDARGLATGQRGTDGNGAMHRHVPPAVSC